MASASLRTVKVRSALLAREYEETPTGITLTGIFSEVTPLGDLAERHSTTACYACIELNGVRPGDVIGLHLVDGHRETLQVYSCALERGFKGDTTVLPFRLVAPLTIPHYTYGLHELEIGFNELKIGSIPFDVRPMPSLF